MRGKSVDLFNRGEALNDPEYYVSIDTVDRLSACVSRPYYFDSPKSKRQKRESLPVVVSSCFEAQDRVPIPTIQQTSTT